MAPSRSVKDTKSAKSTKPSKDLSFHHPSTTKHNFGVTKPQKEYRGKKIFKRKEFALSGSFISCEKPASHEKVGKWITQHGGEYVTEVGNETAYLICSIEDYKKKSPNVKRALAINKLRKGKKIKILTIDWLEECLIKIPVKVAETDGYTLNEVLKVLKDRAESEGKHRKNFENGVVASESFTGHQDTFERDRVTDWAKGFHRIYYDSTAFEYKVGLKRVEVGRERTRIEKYTLFLFQYIGNPKPEKAVKKFHGSPPHFMTAAQLNETIITPKPPTSQDPTPKPAKSHRPISYFREYCIPKDFWSAFADFRHFFHDKTGVEWDQRLEKEVKGKFQYVRPREGRPVGWLPSQRKKKARYPELPVEEDAKNVHCAEPHDKGGEKMNGVQGSVDIEEWQGTRAHWGGDEAMTGLQTTESSDQSTEVEAIDSEPFSSTRRGDSSEVAEQTQEFSVDLTGDESVHGKNNKAKYIISDDDSSDACEGLEEEVGGGVQRPKAMPFEDFDNFEEFDDSDPCEDVQGIEGGVVEGLMKGD